MSIEDQISPKGFLIAMVAVSKSIAAVSPKYAFKLKESLQSASEAGIDPDDLKLLRLLVTSATAIAAGQIDPPL